MSYLDLNDVHIPSVGGTAIAGWGTAVRDNFEAIEDPPRCRAEGTVAQAISDSSTAYPTFHDDVDDTDSMHNPGGANPQIVYINTPGVWSVTAWVRWAPNATGYREARIVNGASTIEANVYTANPSGSRDTHQRIETELLLDASDYLRLGVYQTSGGNLDVERCSLTARLVAQPL